MSIIKFPAKRKEEPQLDYQGIFVCMACKHEWEGEGNVPHKNNIECPNCGTDRGAAKYPFAPASGRIVWACCHCEGQQYFIVKIEQEPYMLCVGCGTETPLIEAYPK